jgi:uncharacterized membrane protein YdfJ with MMPL/SSD domain
MTTRLSTPTPASSATGAPGPPVGRGPHLAQRMGRWSAHHWKTATFGWLAFVVVTAAASPLVGVNQIDPATSGSGESGRADRILVEDFSEPAAESVLVESAKLTVDEPAFRAAVEAAVTTLGAEVDVENVESPLAPGHEGQISDDRHAAVIHFQIGGDPAEAKDKVEAITTATRQVGLDHPTVFVGQFGSTSANEALQEAFASDLERAGLISIPITLAILVLAFGALVAACIPVVLALSAVASAMGLVALMSHVVPMDASVSAMMLLIGLAVGVDYSLFYIKREREERAAGRSESAALEAAAATSGRSVLISGLTVMVAMAGMFLTGDKTFVSFGVATMTVVGVAMLGSLTVLPALLSRLGDRVDKGRVPFVGGRERTTGGGGLWGVVIDRVLRRPGLSVLLAGGLLLALAVPAAQLRTVLPSPDTYPAALPAVETYDRLQEAFPGAETPTVAVLRAPDVTTPGAQSAIADLRERALASGLVEEPVQVAVNAAGTVARVALPVTGEATDAVANDALDLLRDDIVPSTLGSLPDSETGVTGLTAVSRDFNALMTSSLPRVVGFVLLLAFCLMLFAFRSLVVAVKAVLLNLLSVAATFGVMVLVFQRGWAQGWLDFDSTAGIHAFLPIMLFVILFGLSMDYHVFILSRIRETYDRGAGTDVAIAHGIKSTAGVVTSAAVVMVAVFSVFVSLSMITFKQFGVGLAVAILIDATVVRGVLLPATMKLLGDWNWYLPKWLEWLPHIEHGASVDAPPPRGERLDRLDEGVAAPAGPGAVR